MKLKTFKIEIIFFNENLAKFQNIKKLDFRLCSHFQLATPKPQHSSYHWRALDGRVAIAWFHNVLHYSLEVIEY